MLDAVVAFARACVQARLYCCAPSPRTCASDVAWRFCREHRRVSTDRQLTPLPDGALRTVDTEVVPAFMSGQLETQIADEKVNNFIGLDHAFPPVVQSSTRVPRTLSIPRKLMNQHKLMSQSVVGRCGGRDLGTSLVARDALMMLRFCLRRRQCTQSIPRTSDFGVELYWTIHSLLPGLQTTTTMFALSHARWQIANIGRKLSDVITKPFLTFRRVGSDLRQVRFQCFHCGGHRRAFGLQCCFRIRSFVCSLFIRLYSIPTSMCRQGMVFSDSLT
jgi:hypothetical protein